MSSIFRTLDFSAYFVVHPFDSPLVYLQHVNAFPNYRFQALRLSTRFTMKMIYLGHLGVKHVENEEAWGNLEFLLFT